MLATYNICESYAWNYAQGPLWTGPIPKPPATERKTKFFDFELNSPLGIPAGPLLNARWVKLYAELGWDLLTYKTVRTVARASHPPPNCLYVTPPALLTESEAGGAIRGSLEAPADLAEISTTNSLGMPSQAPKVWMADLEKAQGYLQQGQVLMVSITGTPGAGKSLQADYVRCAALAKEAGAKIIEANYSCPNVASSEGSIFADPQFSCAISRALKKEIGSLPLLIKMGNLPNQRQLEEVVASNAPFVDGIAGINTVPMQIVDHEGRQALPGKGRLISGVCGKAIQQLAQTFTEQLFQIRQKQQADFVICGVGGLLTTQDLARRIAGGADVVMAATGALWNPLLACEYRESLREP